MGILLELIMYEDMALCTTDMYFLDTVYGVVLVRSLELCWQLSLLMPILLQAILFFKYMSTTKC